MAGCSVRHEGEGDKDAGVGRVLPWVIGGAILFGIAGFLEAAAVGAALTGLAGLVIAGIVILSAAGGAAVGFFVGFAVNWFDRLFPNTPSTVTISGCVFCAGKNNEPPIQPFHDGDWTFNIGGQQPPAGAFAVLMPTDVSLSDLRNRDAPDNGRAFGVVDMNSGQPVLHCEISSYVGSIGAIGGAVGSIAGAIGGALAGAAACVAFGLATFGIGALVCLLIVALAIFLGAALGGLAGAAIGSVIGLLADALSDFDERGEAVSRGCVMCFTGRWVTDANHEWNEIHDVESAQLIECNNCTDAATGATSAGLVAAVGIGRHPTGLDP